MPYTEVKLRVHCECSEVGEGADPTCTICEGAGWIEKWESFHILLMDADVQFEKDVDDR